MKAIMGFLVSIFAGSAAAEGCLRLVDSGFEAQADDISVSRVEWRAQLENRCDAPYDADLTIRFLDGDGESVYEVRDLVTVPIGGRAQAGNRIYMPQYYKELMVRLAIEVEERRRPF